MDNELLTLSLVNHALAHGLGYDKAWPLAESLVAARTGESVRELADQMRLATSKAVYGV